MDKSINVVFRHRICNSLRAFNVDVLKIKIPTEKSALYIDPVGHLEMPYFVA